MTIEITYQIEAELTVDEFIDLLKRSTLGERRPLNEPATMSAMLKNADVIATARCNGFLVGVARAITDFAYCTYLSDLAVDVGFQRLGIGKQLLQRSHAAAGLNTTLILISAPKAVSYYPHIGMQPHPSCWTLPRQPVSE